MKGRAKTADRDALLARITASADYADLAGCDLVIEAVFEDPKVKAEAIAKARGRHRAGVRSSRPTPRRCRSPGSRRTRPGREQFIGIHFFSPVEKMMLVEVILARQTGDVALAVALDFVRAIRKTPIVVNDARGFYANRCVGNYLREGHLMLMEGVPPAMIENAARDGGHAGRPALAQRRSRHRPRAEDRQGDQGADRRGGIDPVQEKLLRAMVEKHGRLGRKNRKGFYDYPEKGPKTPLARACRDLPAAAARSRYARRRRS